MLKLESHIKFYTLIVGNFNTPLSLMDSSVRETLNREKRELTDVKPQMDLTAIYRTHPNTKDYTFFSALHGTFSKLNTYFVTKQTLTDTKEKMG